ncbi:MAG: hypothetical protein H6618_05190 [Deltaproteobacteria bacterium]|nr:hypothetical protein [Deltaproteobacteria bacterium]
MQQEQKTGQQAWKTFLPELFNWAGQVKLSVHPDCPESHHHLLMLREKKDSEGAYEIDAPLLPDEQRRQLMQQMTELGYQKIPEPVTLRLGDSFYTLVSQSALDLSDVRKARQAGLDGARILKNLGVKSLCLHAGEQVPSSGILEGLGLGLYQLTGFRNQSGNNRVSQQWPERIMLAGNCHGDPEEIRTSILASCLSRLLADAPSDWLNPEQFAKIAEDMSAEQGLSCRIRKRAELQDMGMGAFISVGNGSVCEPHLIEIQIKGKNPDKTMVLVGKGLTFDAGGVSLKPSLGMDEMKYDMCGGAAVLGAAYYLSRHQPPVNVVCLIGAVENLIGSTSTRPGDIVRSMSGKTIEVLNTDAEGRLVLADLLHYAQSQWKPEAVVDVATLTGAVLYALGSIGSAFVSNDRHLASYLRNTAESAGEPLWELPLWPELAREVRSELADLKNIAGSAVKAGTLVGGTFLREFAGSVPWAHIDIAGTAWNCKGTGYPASGSSAFILKTLAKLCLNYESAL